MNIRALLDFLYEELRGAESESKSLQRKIDCPGCDHCEGHALAHVELLSAAQYRRDIVDKAIDLALATDHDDQKSALDRQKP